MKAISSKLRLLAAVFLLFGLCSSCAPFATAATPKGYVVDSSVALDPAQNGISGFLQTLRDSRITPAMRKELWGSSNDPEMGLSERELKIFAKVPIRKARLRLVDGDGQVLAEEKFDYNLAEVGVTYLYGTRFPTYLVTVDTGYGVGSYRGPETSFAEIREGRLSYIEAAEDGGKRLSLTDSGNYGWRIVPSAAGAGMEMEAVLCDYDPSATNKGQDEDEAKFIVTYSTYRFDGRPRHRASRQESGFWENDDDESSWPDRARFP